MMENEDHNGAVNGQEQLCVIPNNRGYFFIPDLKSQNALSTFQYRGEDRSLLYRFILSPLALFCVYHLTPCTLAPNTITLIGLILMFGSYCFAWYYVPTFQEQQSVVDTENDVVVAEVVPRWIYLYSGIVILVYQTLDNMDGKQARKTNSSSPLGLLFDHGCDAVNSLFGSVNWIVALGLNPFCDKYDLLLCGIALFGPYALFYVGTWEEYYTGALILPLCNGPNEGLLGAALMNFASYVHGPSYWHRFSWWNNGMEFYKSVFGTSKFLESIRMRNADMLLLASSIGFIQEIVGKIATIVPSFGLKALTTLVPFVTLVSCYVVVSVVRWTPSECESNLLWLKMPRTSLHLCAGLFVEMVTDLMLRHITSQSYPSFRWILCPLVAMSIWMVFDTSAESMDRACNLLLTYSSIVCTVFLMKITFVIHEICSILNIYCFDIVTSRDLQSSRYPVEHTRTAVKPFEPIRMKKE
jgi:ethanolaminephosphotransferase